KVVSGMESLGPEFAEDTAVQRARFAELLLEVAESQAALVQAEQADKERGDSRKTNWIKKVVARGEIQTEDWDSAAKLLKLGVEKPDFLNAVLNEARILLRDPKNESASSLADKLLIYSESRVVELPEGSWLKGATLTLRGWQMVRAKRWADAEPTLLDAVKTVESSAEELAEEQVKQRELFRELAVRLLVEVYQANGAADKAAEWRAKLNLAK
ncbi:MAG: hypothetical protein ACKO81_11930, partial [Planctomycetota bacterium]